MINDSNLVPQKQVLNSPIETSVNIDTIDKKNQKDEVLEKKENDSIVEDTSLFSYQKAPLVGTFYNSPKPGEPSFIKAGDKITKGQTLCIIEAMKIFNEIESEVSGKIVKVLVDDNSPVEYDQPLFLVDPS